MNSGLKRFHNSNTCNQWQTSAFSLRICIHKCRSKLDNYDALVSDKSKLRCGIAESLDMSLLAKLYINGLVG